MPRLALYLLGAPRIELDSESMHIGRTKAVALLAYLAVTGTPHSREALATLLWPESTSSRARASLRRVLVTLRHLIFNVDVVEGYDTSGPIMGAVVALVAVGALVLGLLYDAKAGFCNAMCPVLPVERLYCQSPLIDVPNPRCVPCTI